MLWYLAYLNTAKPRCKLERCSATEEANAFESFRLFCTEMGKKLDE